MKIRKSQILCYVPYLTEQEKIDLKRYTSSDLNINADVVLYIGNSKSSYCGNYIKVSNISSYSENNDVDCFNITIPELRILGDVCNEHITKNKLKLIFKFCIDNKKTLIDRCLNKITNEEFLLKIKK